MQEDVSSNQMYLILNKAIAECFNHNNWPVDVAMENFREKHWKTLTSSEKTENTSSSIPTLREVSKAGDFCSLLDEFRISIDPYNDDNEELSTDKFRKIYNYIDYFRPHIMEQYHEDFVILEKVIKSHLPEYSNDAVLNAYNERALNITKLKKSLPRDKTNKEKITQRYQQEAKELFSDIISQNNLHTITASPNKLKTYLNILEVVDCLPKEEYSKIEKIKLKYKINLAMSEMCQELGTDYISVKEKADKEVAKQIRSLKNAQNPSSGKPSISDLRRKRQRDEYLYK